MSVYIENFETIFGVSNNIQALRNKVLELAIQGKLVEQDPNDEPASDLIEKIQAERGKLVKGGKVKKQKSLELIKKDEIPFDIPKGWKWARLGDVGELISGRDEAVSDCNDKGLGLPYVMGASNINNGKFIPQRWISVPKVISKYGDLVITVKGTVGKYFINTYGNINLSRQTMALRPYLCEMVNYISMWFKTYISELNSQSLGIIPGISRENVLEAIIPIPPYAEQHRIITKIEWLMAEIDRLEEFLQEKEKLMEKLPKAIVDAIGSCKTGEELKEQLHFVIENFETIFQSPESMQELKNVILQLAIEGKLLAQNPSDEPASELVKRIQVERDKLVKEGKIKKQKPLAPIGEDEIPFEIPGSWEWVRLGALSEIKGGKRVSAGYSLLNETTEHVYIRVADMKNGTVRMNDLRYIDEKEFSKIKNYTISKDDIYITIAGTIGVVGIVPDELDGMNLTENASKVVFYSMSHVSQRFFYWLLSSPVVQRQFSNMVNQMAQPKLALTRIVATLIPFPPIDEQYRIVQKVELIMSLIDQMETELKRKNDVVVKMGSV